MLKEKHTQSDDKETVEQLRASGAGEKHPDFGERFTVVGDSGGTGIRRVVHIEVPRRPLRARAS